MDHHETLATYLRNQVTDDGESPSHTSMVGGKWFIPKADDDRFFELYLAALDEGTPQYISERILPGRMFHFFVDIDLPSFEIVDAIIEHNGYGNINEFYRNFVDMAENALRDVTDNNIRSIFSRKRRISHKFHINFPTVACSRRVALDVLSKIRTQFLDRFRINEHPALLDVNWEKVFDRAPYSGGLRMLGSRKEIADGPNDEYNVVNLEIGDFLPLTVELLKDTSIRMERRCVDAERPLVQYENQNAGIPYMALRSYVAHLRRENVFGDRLPLSIHDHGMKPTFDGASFIVALNDRWCPFKNNYHQRTSRILYLLVSPQGARLKCYDEVCKSQNLPIQALTPEMTAAFANISPVSLYISPNEQRYFERMGIRLQLTPEVRELMARMSTAEFHIAQVFEAVFRNKFCAIENGKDKTFLVFERHIFRPGNAVALLSLSFILPALYRLFIHELYPDTFRNDAGRADRQRPNPGDADVVMAGDAAGDVEVQAVPETGDLEKIKKAKIGIVTSILHKLGGNASTAILAKAWTLFWDLDPNVLAKLDTARHLMAFENGILDFSDNEAPDFRAGRYSDFLTISTKTVFQYLTPEDEKVREVQQFIKSLFPKRNIREYVLKIISKCLTAADMERLYIFTGSGSNGKTKLVKLISRSFGEYWRDMSVSVLTQKRKASNAASPEIVDTKGRHIITTQEPETDVRLNSGVIKQTTGGDPVSVRQLYGTQFVFEPKATFFMCCNDIPSPENCDGGITRRFRIIPLEQKFVSNPNPAKLFEQKIDDELDRKIAGWGSAFAYILYFYRIQYPSPIVDECEDVIRYTKEIAQESDHFFRFDHENLGILTPDEERAGYYTPFDVIWGLYETFCGVHKLKNIPKHSLWRRLHETYGVSVVDEVARVFVSVTGDQQNANMIDGM